MKLFEQIDSKGDCFKLQNDLDWFINLFEVRVYDLNIDKWTQAGMYTRKKVGAGGITK